MKLSNRLQMIASFVTKGSTIVDIGTDHGYIPIYLVQESIVETGIAMDIGKEPLERAARHIEEQKLEDVIELRLSDGLERLKPGEVDTVILAGMGGALIMKILTEGSHLWNDIKEFILSPQSEQVKVRKFLIDQGFQIVKEEMVAEDGKYYTVMKALRGPGDYDRYIDLKYGKLLLQVNHPVLLDYLNKEEEKCNKILANLNANPSESAISRVREVLREKKEILEAKDEMRRNH